jgi:hypothetical protein
MISMNDSENEGHYEDGVYVEFFPDDPTKENEPESIVIIRDNRLELHLNPRARDFQFRWFARINSLIHRLQGKPYFVNHRIETMLHRMWTGGANDSPNEYHPLQSKSAEFYEELADEWLDQPFVPWTSN